MLSPCLCIGTMYTNIASERGCVVCLFKIDAFSFQKYTSIILRSIWIWTTHSNTHLQFWIVLGFYLLLTMFTIAVSRSILYLMDLFSRRNSSVTVWNNFSVHICHDFYAILGYQIPNITVVSLWGSSKDARLKLWAKFKSLFVYFKGDSKVRRIQCVNFKLSVFLSWCMFWEWCFLSLLPTRQGAYEFAFDRIRCFSVSTDVDMPATVVKTWNTFPIVSPSLHSQIAYK